MEGKVIHPKLNELFPELVELRRDFHKHPELMYDLPRTSKKVAEYLRTLNIEVVENVAQSGVVGIIRKPGPCILLRADMDALPITEDLQTDYTSVHPGRKHACGHDAHTAMLLVAAKVIAANSEELKGSVKFCFQPAEEGGNGAKAMIEDSNYRVLENPDVSEVYGIHVTNALPIGDIWLSEKYMSCDVDFFTIKIRGKGGHASTPHLCIDPLVTGSHLVLELQRIVAREVNPKHQAVVSVTCFKGGEAYNAIPEHCEIRGTTRCYEKEVKELIDSRMQEICNGVGRSSGCEVELIFHRLYDPITNDPDCIQKTLDTYRAISPNFEKETSNPMIGEDFSEFTKVKPGCFYMLGCATEEKNAHLHTAQFDIEERAMLIGASYWVKLVENLLINN